MKYRIYVIEDDENIRNLICVALENFGYCASGFETAEEALDSLSALLRRGREAQREYPAMFVFDCMLPGMDGMAAIRKIREMPDFSAAPVLMLTSPIVRLETSSFAGSTRFKRFLTRAESSRIPNGFVM